MQIIITIWEQVRLPGEKCRVIVLYASDIVELLSLGNCKWNWFATEMMTFFLKYFIYWKRAMYFQVTLRSKRYSSSSLIIRDQQTIDQQAKFGSWPGFYFLFFNTVLLEHSHVHYCLQVLLCYKHRFEQLTERLYGL